MEYNKDRFVLDRFCEFSNRGAESDFMDYEKAASLNIVRILILVMGFTFAMFIFSDYYYHEAEHRFIVSLALRGAALFITVVVFFLIRKIERYENTLVVITLTELIVSAIYLVNLYYQKSKEPALQFMSVMLLILAVFLIPNKWKNCLIASCAILSSYIIFCILFLEASESPSLTQRGIYLGICLLSCAIFLYGRESSERKHFAAEKLLEFLSITDRLTGIYNRGRFEFIVNLWIKNTRHDPFCLILFDIDDFKKVNDRFGHSAGDQVLVKTTEIVNTNIRDDDIFARWGGEEFVILFSTTGIERAAELAERLRKAVEENPCDEAGKVTISIGVAQFRRGESILELVNRADEKMYEAKKAGKNLVVAEKIS